MTATETHSDSAIDNWQKKRVALVVDNDNLYISLKDVGVTIVDYDLLFRFGEEFGTVTVARVYTSKAEVPVEGHMRTAGFEVRYVATNGFKRSNVDATMITHIMRLEAEVFILVTGDGDYEPTVRQLREEGKYVIVVGVEERTSKALRATAHQFKDYRTLQKAVQR